MRTALLSNVELRAREQKTSTAAYTYEPPEKTKKED
jgi:hypothetical protein